MRRPFCIIPVDIYALLSFSANRIVYPQIPYARSNGKIAVHKDGNFLPILGLAHNGQIGGTDHKVHMGDRVVEALGLQLLLTHLLATLDTLGIGLTEGQVAGGILIKEGVVEEDLLVADGAVVGNLIICSSSRIYFVDSVATIRKPATIQHKNNNVNVVDKFILNNILDKIVPNTSNANSIPNIHLFFLDLNFILLLLGNAHHIK